MAWKAKSPCTYPGCGELSDESRCPRHRSVEKREADRRRPGAAERGYNGSWAKARAEFLRRNPYCVECERQRRRIKAEVVDHIRPPKGNDALFWDQSNWQGLCRAHHDFKTNRFDGGFGNRIRA